MRLATSSRNGLTTPSTILNGAPSRVTSWKSREVRSGPSSCCWRSSAKRMQTAAEQGSHLLRGHRVADGQAVDRLQAGTDPHPRRLTPFGVIRRQPGVTFLGRIQGCDLPGQIVIPGPSCELVEAHRHTHPKGVHTAGAVMPTRATSGGASGVSDLESFGVRGGTSDGAVAGLRHRRIFCLSRCRAGQVVEGDELAAIWQEQRQDMCPIAGTVNGMPPRGLVAFRA